MKQYSKIVAFIPARGGSKGIPGKNIKNFEGKPLISHSIEYAKDSKLVTEGEHSTVTVSGKSLAEFL